MNKQQIIDSIEALGIIPAVRVSSHADALFASETVFNAGIPVVEITMTTPEAHLVIRELASRFSGLIVGAGTVLDLDCARQCFESGACFLTSTGFDPEVHEFARENQIVSIPGVLTPTEVMAARRAGADFVKIFPCANLGGPDYIRALKSPFPGIRFIASGGVNQQTAIDYIRAGSSALGIGTGLLPHEAVRKRNPEWIHELARRFLDMVRTGRELNHFSQSGTR